MEHYQARSSDNSTKALKTLNTPTSISQTSGLGRPYGSRQVGGQVVSASVVIATYNRGTWLLDTIEHVMRNEYPQFELIVVDQTKEYEPTVTGRLDEARQKYGFQYVRLPFPCLTFARNVGLKHAKGDVVIFCDDDVVVAADYIEQHVRCYSDPAVGAVAGRVVSKMDAALSHPSGAIGRVMPDGSFIANFHGEQRGEVDFGMGCNMSFRRSALEEVGGFDERYTGGFYREEGDAFARVKRRGHRVVFEPDACLEHLASPDGGCRKDVLLPRMYTTFRNETLFFFNCMRLRHLPRFTNRLFRWMYATVRSRNFSLTKMAYFSCAFFGGLKAYYFERPNKLSATLRD
jgi:GT2 family glycosyltransferase